jgi:hypothetical protein
MGIWAWIVLLAVSAAVATVGRYLVSRLDPRPTDYDWVYLAGGGLIGGFTAQLWYPIGPTFDGLSLMPMLVGVIVGAAVLEVVYRVLLRPRRT